MRKLETCVAVNFFKEQFDINKSGPVAFQLVVPIICFSASSCFIASHSILFIFSLLRYSLLTHLDSALLFPIYFSNSFSVLLFSICGYRSAIDLRLCKTFHCLLQTVVLIIRFVSHVISLQPLGLRLCSFFQYFYNCFKFLCI